MQIGSGISEHVWSCLNPVGWPAAKNKGSLASYANVQHAPAESVLVDRQFEMQVDGGRGGEEGEGKETRFARDNESETWDRVHAYCA